MRISWEFYFPIRLTCTVKKIVRGKFFIRLIENELLKEYLFVWGRYGKPNSLCNFLNKGSQQESLEREKLVLICPAVEFLEFLF